jgi:acyl-CoA thioesterase-1
MMKSFFKSIPLAAAFTWLVLAASLAQADEQKHLLIVGDSLSAAYGMEQSQAWVSLLQARLDEKKPQRFTITNASISGETTDGGLRRLPDLLSRHQPDIVIIELGGNDGLRGFPPQVIEQNLRQMIELSQQNQAEVLLIGIEIPPNYGKRYTEAFSQIFVDLAQQYELALLPFFLDGVFDGEAMMQSDGIHPTAAAQPQLLDNVWPVLKPLLQ